MVQWTSWEGKHTKRIRRKGVKGAYTRYSNRKTRTGLQVVKSTKNYNKVFSPDGRFIGIEPKYKSFATYDPTARRIYKQKIRKQIPTRLRRKIL